MFGLKYLHICFFGILYLFISGCMRLEPTHPYDPESPPEYRAPASLISALYSADVPQDYDFKNFEVVLTATNFDGLYTRQPDTDGRFRFEGIPPGIYVLSAEGEMEGELYGIEGEEIFLPVGEKVSQPFFTIVMLER